MKITTSCLWGPKPSTFYRQMYFDLPEYYYLLTKSSSERKRARF